VLQPKEEGAIKFELDSSRFIGRKTLVYYVQVEQGTTKEDWRFTIRANSQEAEAKVFPPAQ
jgi:hypothetical protein